MFNLNKTIQLSYFNTMSSVAINRGSFKDILKSGIKSAGNKDVLKSVAVSGLTADITKGITDKLNLNNKENNGNVLASGANIQGKDVNIDVANNLTVESLQDTYYSKTKTNSYGGTVGTSWGSLSANYNDGYSKTNSQWVNNQTSIIGNNSVVINTNNNTDIKGSIIASGEYKELELPKDQWKINIETGETIKTKTVFKDNNNLTLNTNSLTYSNIYDTNTSKSQNIGGGIGTTVSFNYSNGGHDKEQTTKATIGNGSIVIADKEINSENNNLNLIRELNRDVNNSQEITKDESTGGYNFDVSVNILGLVELCQKGFGQFTEDKLDELDKNINKIIDLISDNYNKIFNKDKALSNKVKEEVSEKLKDIIENNKEELNEMAKEYVATNGTDLTEEEVKIIILSILYNQGVLLAYNGDLKSLGLSEKNFNKDDIMMIVRAIETKGGKEYENFNKYVTDENGKLFTKAVQCMNKNSCYQVEKDNSKTWFKCDNGVCTRKDKDGKEITIKIKVDKNGIPVRVLAPAYVNGKYDTISLGSIHWAGKTGNLGGGLDLLLENAKKDLPDFYNEYVKIAGLDKNKRPITDSSKLSSEQISKLNDFINKYKDNTKFKNFESKIAKQEYFDKPVSKLPKDIQERVKNSQPVVQQLIMSTYVQFGNDSDFVQRIMTEQFNNKNQSDKDAMIKIIKKTKQKRFPNRAKIEIDSLNKFYKQNKGK